MANYRATRNSDGTFVIHDVPIFVECERGDKSFDREWIAQAFAKAQQAEKDGYFPPLHCRHHGPGADDVRPAGFFRITRIGPMAFKGSAKLAMFADLTITDPSAEMDLVAKRFPYRSVEIVDWTSPSIDSLALLDHEAPYLELPMLTVQEIGGERTPTVASATFSNPYGAHQSSDVLDVVACFSKGSASLILFQEDSDMDEDKDKKDDSESMAEGMDVSAIVKAIESGEITMNDFEAIRAAMASREGASEAEPEMDEMPAPAGMMNESMQRKELTVDPKTQARLDAQDAEIAKLRNEREQEKAVAAAMSRLEGRPMGDPVELEKRLNKAFAKFKKDGFEDYITELETTFARVEAKYSSDKDKAERFGKQGGMAMNKAVSDWQALGAEQASLAAQFSAEWDQLTQVGGTRMSRERHIELSMNRRGHFLTKAETA